MIAASFTAWQIGRINGLKSSWSEYLDMIGLGEKKEVTEEETKETTATGLRILKRLGKI